MVEADEKHPDVTRSYLASDLRVLCDTSDPDYRSAPNLWIKTPDWHVSIDCLSQKCMRFYQVCGFRPSIGPGLAGCHGSGTYRSSSFYLWDATSR